MLNTRNQVEAKKTARALETALKAAGLHLSHGQALDTLARVHGFKDFNALNASLTPRAVDEELMSIEREHIEGYADCNYGRECALVAHTGFELRYSSNIDVDVEYVRVCDPLGREIAYWHYDEWKDDPQVVMGAILGALVRGQPLDVQPGKPAKLAAPKSRVPRIVDVDFMKAHSVIFDDQCYRIEWREVDVLALLEQPKSAAFAEMADAAALRLSFLDKHGLAEDEVLSLETLASLTWNAEQRRFVDNEGSPYDFFFEVNAETYFAMK